MLKILKLLSFQIFLSLLFVSHLEAVKISSQFYKANEIPAECIRQTSPEIQKFNMGYDCTIITLKGLPKNKVITIFQKRLSQNKTDELGTLNSGNEGEIEQRVGALWYIPGEPVTFIFKYNKKKEELTLIPKPLYVESEQNGATIEAKLISIDPPNYQIEMKGFKEKEILFFQSIAYNEHLAIKIPVDKTTAFGYSPGVIGKKGGINYLQFTRLSGENLKLQLPWGLELLKYNVYEENNELKLKIKDEAFLKQNPEVAKYFRSNRHPTAKFSTPQF